ncbi:hypothetical protein [uncultured Algibacter sp.]|uniref:hypothetical protein n=1 Tax=uncultured Algibacter sp. TaxID=298659 RepID=UPI0032172A4B
MGTATIVESGCKVYDINFSDNIPVLTDIIFTSINNKYLSGGSNRKIAIRISDEGVLVVTQIGVVSFVEGRK